MQSNSPVNNGIFSHLHPKHALPLNPIRTDHSTLTHTMFQQPPR